MFYQNFSSPQAKRCAIITHPTAFSPMGRGGGGGGGAKGPHKKKKKKRLMVLGNQEISGKY